MTGAGVPVVFLLHPVGVGATRSMNVLSAKLWLRALVDLLPDVVISAPWIPYAEVMVDRDRGLRDALICAESHYGAVACGGEFNRGTSVEWELFGRLSRPRIDLTNGPAIGPGTDDKWPEILTYETFGKTRTPVFQKTVLGAFQTAFMKKAA